MHSLKEIAQALEVDCVAKVSPDSTGSHLFCSESYNLPSGWEDIKNPMDTSTDNGKVFLTGTPRLIEHIDAIFMNHFISSVAIVPILKNNTVISTLELIITKKDRSFAKDVIKKAQYQANLLSDEL
jgi:hypothetical protein